MADQRKENTSFLIQGSILAVSSVIVRLIGIVSGAADQYPGGCDRGIQFCILHLFRYLVDFFFWHSYRGLEDGGRQKRDEALP